MIPVIINIILSLVLSGYEQTDSDIKFNHKAHFSDRDIECKTCHKVAQSQSADDQNIPGHDECSECHSVSEAPDDCRLCHTDPNNPKGIDIPDRELIFPHKTHLNADESSEKCLDCHNGVNQASGKLSDNAYPKMEKCFQCHDGVGASAECETCHSQPSLVSDLVHSPDWEHAHQFAATTEQRESCAPCHHAETFCSDCHAGDNLVETVHDLNYRYNHGLDVKGKEFTCQNCHDPQSFCNECHSQQDIIPFYHLYQSFNPRINPGTHAEYARMDIESCASCHDEESFTCGQPGCHSDGDGIKGTNPSVHPNSFMESEQGPWHEDPGYQCFQCHRNSRNAGAGFCGYCHGEKTED